MRNGEFVKASRLIDYAPYTLIDAGEVGRVLAQVEDVVLIRLEKHHPGLGEGNVVTLMPEDAEAFQPTMSPVAIKRALGAAVSAVGIVVGVLLLPHLSVEPKSARSETVEKAYLQAGPPAVQRVNQLPDGSYVVVTLLRSRPGSKLYVITAMRPIAAQDLEAELEKIE